MTLIIILTRIIYPNQIEPSICFTLEDRLHGEILRLLRIQNRLLNLVYRSKFSTVPLIPNAPNETEGVLGWGSRSIVPDVVNRLNRSDRSGWHWMICVSWAMVFNYLHDLHCWSGKSCPVRRLLSAILTFSEIEINTTKSRIPWSNMLISPYHVGQYLHVVSYNQNKHYQAASLKTIVVPHSWRFKFPMILWDVTLQSFERIEDSSDFIWCLWSYGCQETSQGGLSSGRLSVSSCHGLLSFHKYFPARPLKRNVPHFVKWNE